MNDFYAPNLKAIEHMFPELNIQPYKEALQKIDDKLEPCLLGVNKSLWLISRNAFFAILPHAKKAEVWVKREVEQTQLVQMPPHGKAFVTFKPHDVRLTIDGIMEGDLVKFLEQIQPVSKS
ncbi:hypothetical protein A6A19_02755 [Actinobacillus delphinicola]|uniref:DUF5655 domain-containing protein n=1 Tax=Actinobacillus delphinicola TaxID=51161 RepID=A0A448TRZ1_9PAST|nr:hypothetical protein [Actinobacillus delphinicola]MDG6896944.1 hypothetical protein [Actinobacillus delphinicola]VEJ08760.1 Uncharacterised protein [Actinobacillus delphinicola]